MHTAHVIDDIGTAFTNSLAQKLLRDFSFYGFAAEQNGFS